MLSTLITIALLHWAILILPGFNFILVGQLAASGQRTTAMFAVAGMTTATLVWACLAVAGVGIVFTAHPQVRQVAQLAGGGLSAAPGLEAVALGGGCGHVGAGDHG